MTRLAHLQRSLFDLVLAPSPDPFLADPGAWGAARGLGPKDQASLHRGAARFAVYRELVQFALTDPVEDCYPILMAHLEAEGAWQDCLAAFLGARVIQGPYYREVAPAFLAWLATTGWGAERWPFLLPLAHWEHLELELLRHPDDPVPGHLSPQPTPGSRAHPHPTLRNLTYPVRVSEAAPDRPIPPDGALHLLAWRDAEGAFRSLELSPSASALVARWLEGEPLASGAAPLGLDVEEALGLAQRLVAEGALVGFR